MAKGLVPSMSSGWPHKRVEGGCHPQAGGLWNCRRTDGLAGWTVTSSSSGPSLAQTTSAPRSVSSTSADSEAACWGAGPRVRPLPRTHCSDPLQLKGTCEHPQGAGCAAPARCGGQLPRGMSPVRPWRPNLLLLLLLLLLACQVRLHSLCPGRRALVCPVLTAAGSLTLSFLAAVPWSTSRRPSLPR